MTCIKSPLICLKEESHKKPSYDVLQLTLQYRVWGGTIYPHPELQLSQQRELTCSLQYNVSNHEMTPDGLLHFSRKDDTLEACTQIVFFPLK
jgi:hypothetical protein